MKSSRWLLPGFLVARTAAWAPTLAYGADAPPTNSRAELRISTGYGDLARAHFMFSAGIRVYLGSSFYFEPDLLYLYAGSGDEGGGLGIRLGIASSRKADDAVRLYLDTGISSFDGAALLSLGGGLTYRVTSVIYLGPEIRIGEWTPEGARTGYWHVGLAFTLRL